MIPGDRIKVGEDKGTLRVVGSEFCQVQFDDYNYKEWECFHYVERKKIETLE